MTRDHLRPVVVLIATPTAGNPTNTLAAATVNHRSTAGFGHNTVDSDRSSCSTGIVGLQHTTIDSNLVACHHSLPCCSSLGQPLHSPHHSYYCCLSCLLERLRHLKAYRRNHLQRQRP